jgi:glycosyltransferase involved in cell wall biosynthesis
MPTVIVEALASGARVVASSVDGVPDVLRHLENGWLCREKDPMDLAEKILAALRDPPSSLIVESALATAESLDWSKVGENYARVFQRVLGSRSASETSG